MLNLSVVHSFKILNKGAVKKLSFLQFPCFGSGKMRNIIFFFFALILRTANTAAATIKTRLHSGYTTWYNYYGNVTEKIVKRDLQALLRLTEKLDIFQIDDGYQNAIGDWLILGCGVPLAPAFGKVDFCRIGADMGLNR